MGTLAFLPLGLFQITQPQLGDRDLIGFQTSPNELAPHPEPCKIDL
jgi:hypothetical protein